MFDTISCHKMGGRMITGGATITFGSRVAALPCPVRNTVGLALFDVLASDDQLSSSSLRVKEIDAGETAGTKRRRVTTYDRGRVGLDHCHVTECPSGVGCLPLGRQEASLSH